MFAGAPAALVRCSWAGWAGAGLLLIAFTMKSRQEDRLLASVFGAEYADYRSRVPRVDAACVLAVVAPDESRTPV
jgi:protein-S-isoprenylcysteine O-methyltransferase Ste14